MFAIFDRRAASPTIAVAAPRRRDVTLVANNYPRNRSMHETWLESLGCRCAESVADALPGGSRRAA